MSEHQSKDPLHGITLENILKFLIERFGWEELGQLIRVDCFNNDPSIKSSLKFLRKQQWARTKVERLYVKTKRREQRLEDVLDDAEQKDLLDEVSQEEANDSED